MQIIKRLDELETNEGKRTLVFTSIGDPTHRSYGDLEHWRNLIKKAITICSTPDALEKEIKHLKKVFCEINQYPDKVVDNILIMK